MDLTEMITFQILLIILKKDVFKLDITQKYFSAYKKFFDKNEVQHKQARTLLKHFKMKLNRIKKMEKKEGDNENAEAFGNYLEQSIYELESYLNNINI